MTTRLSQFSFCASKILISHPIGGKIKGIGGKIKGKNDIF